MCEVDAALLKAIQSVSPKTNWMRTTPATTQNKKKTKKDHEKENAKTLFLSSSSSVRGLSDESSSYWTVVVVVCLCVTKEFCRERERSSRRFFAYLFPGKL